MTQRSRPQADNNATVAYIDSGPYSRDQWAERMYAVYTGDENTASQRTQLRGVVPTFDNMLVVTNPAGVTIRVGTGAGISAGSFLFNSATVDFTPDTPAIAARIDKVVICENNTNAVYTGAASAVILDFPTVLADYDATPGIGPYAARLAILRGDDATGAATALVQTANYWMIELARYAISNVPVVSSLTDYREFINIEQIVGAVASENADVHTVANLGVAINDGNGADNLGAAVRFNLEDDIGTSRYVGQLALRYTDSTAASLCSRLELRLLGAGGENYIVINGTNNLSAAGNARGLGAVDLQQYRNANAEVASGAESVISGGALNAASGDYSTVPGGYDNTADGNYSLAAGRQASDGNFDGVFIWADGEAAAFTADRANQFKVRASGSAEFTQNAPAAALPVMKLTQTDQDETFVDFVGTTAADQTKSISTVNGDGVVDGPKNFAAAAGWSFVGMIKIDVNGAPFWIPYYQPDLA
jgi:hypothetical protein